MAQTFTQAGLLQRLLVTVDIMLVVVVEGVVTVLKVVLLAEKVVVVTERLTQHRPTMQQQD